MRFSFSAFVFHVFVVGTTTCRKADFSNYGSTENWKKTKNHRHATAAPTPTPPVSYLIAQPGLDCSIHAQPATLIGLSQGGLLDVNVRQPATVFSGATTPTQSDDDKRYYTLRASVSNATIAFAERPTRTAITVSTQDFVDEFEDDLFVTSNPNGAITFFSEEDEGVSASVPSAAAAVDSDR